MIIVVRGSIKKKLADQAASESSPTLIQYPGSSWYTGKRCGGAGTECCNIFLTDRPLSIDREFVVNVHLVPGVLFPKLLAWLAHLVSYG